MFGLGNNDDEQRMWNFVLFKFYGTDEEYSKVAPYILGVAIIIIIGVLIFF